MSEEKGLGLIGRGRGKSGGEGGIVPRAALAEAAATRLSTTDARKATVDMIGLPLCENGIGWYASGPKNHKNKTNYTKNENYTNL